MNAPSHDISRRVFLVAGGSLALGVAFNTAGAAGARAGIEKRAAFEPNAFIQIDPDETVTLTMPRVEMGQGTYTALSMLIAEELEISLARVNLAHAPPDASRYGNPRAGGAQITGGSNSVQGAWEPLRTAGAIARVMLFEAAAQEWRVAAAECSVQDGVVIHASSGRQLSYGQLSQRAAGLPLPQQVTLKAPETFKLIGRPLKRLDAAEKVDGRARYGIDARLPKMRYAAVAASPALVLLCHKSSFSLALPQQGH